MPKRVFEIPGALTQAVTPEAYAAVQLKFSKKTPREATTAPLAELESDDVIRLKCTCGNYPAVDPQWRISRCLLCGLVYREVTMDPEGVDHTSHGDVNAETVQ